VKTRCIFDFYVEEEKEKLTKAHESELSELREFFEKKMLETESGYLEEITKIKEQQELQLGMTLRPN
jgi:hypothetical protein